MKIGFKALYGNFYTVWINMKRRCFNENNPNYSNYGGRGITVCKEWMHFSNFCSDMYLDYIKGLTLERIDNDKGYCFENCKWATFKEQANNRRTHDMKGENSHRVKLNEKQVRVIKHILNKKRNGGSTMTYHEIGNIFGVTDNGIGSIARGQSWSHIII